MAKSDFRSALEHTNEIELGTIGRVSKRQTTRPVWFVRQEETLYFIPLSGSNSQWYQNVVATPQIHLTASGSEYDTEATLITDPAGVTDVVDEFRAKYGADQVAKFYNHPDVAVRARLS
jgi:hypothetical protein